MDLSREIIACALREGTLDPFLAAGITGAWLGNQADPTRNVIFHPEDLDAYQALLRHWDAHGKVPTVEMFRRSFPEASYRLPKSEYTPDELTGIFREDRRRWLAELAVSDLADLVGAGRFDDIAPLIENFQAADRSLRGSGLSLLSLDDLENLPDPDPLIDGVLDARTVTMLAGPSGKGKSFVALDWALSLASSSPWLGRKAKRRRVLYVAAEGAHGQKWRVRAWREGHPEAASPDSYVRFLAHAVQFGSPDELGELIGAARNFDVIILDTLAKITVGMEENSASDMGQFISDLYKLRDVMSDGEGGTVIVVHHTGYDTSRARGSSAIQAGVDNAVSIDAKDPHDLMTIKCAKRKDGAPFQDITARLAECGPSAIVEAAEGQLEEARKYGDRAQEVIAHLTANPGSTTRSTAEALGVSTATAGRVLSSLAGKGDVVSLPGGGYKAA